MECCVGQSSSAQCLSNTWLLPFATLPLHCSRCFCLFDLYCQAAETAETVDTLSALLAARRRGKSGIRLAWTQEVLKLPGGECYQTLYQVNTNEWDINLSFWGMSLADFLFKYLLRLWKIWNVEVNIGLSPLDGPYLDRWPETGDWRWTRNAEVDLQLGILHTLPSASSTLK